MVLQQHQRLTHRLARHRTMRRRALQAAHHGGDVAAHQGGILRVTLVGASPARITRHGGSGGKRPVEPGDPHLECVDLPDAADELRVARRSQPDVVRKYRGSRDVVVPVHRIRPPQRGDAGGPGRAERGVIEPVGKREPLTGWSELIAVGRGIAAVQNGSEGIVTQVIGSDAVDIGLDELTDLLLGPHAREQKIEAPLEALIARRYRPQLRPALRVHPRRARGAEVGAGRGLKRAQRQSARAIARDAGRSLFHDQP